MAASVGKKKKKNMNKALSALFSEVVWYNQIVITFFVII